MMKKLFPLFLAVPVFLAALVLLWPPPGVAVVVAAADLPEGLTLSPADLALRQLPPDLVPPGAFHDPAGLVGQTLRVARSPGDAILPANLGGEQLHLGTHERAVAIRVSDSAGLAGLLRPGDTVGVTAVLEGSGGAFAKTVAGGLRVLYLSPEFRSGQSQGGQTADAGMFGGGVSAPARPRETEGTVLLAVPVDAVSIGYDFSAFGLASESRLVNLTDLLPALDLVANVRLSLFLEPAAAGALVTSGLFLPDLVVTPGPSPTPTECAPGACGELTPQPTAGP
jgi:pilus assembly protein CpaB